ncbi:hypothetical protein P7H17_18375 [Paenibacillus larvae]|nr:hypothetical protein [Paenibacillus larvae]MDT2287630.1 hypothetical protein [Paenibacillus larvae]
MIQTEERAKTIQEPTVHDVAKAFLRFGINDSKKLQKLCYLARHFFYLAIYEKKAV